jgi:hypothetical protein
MSNNKPFNKTSLQSALLEAKELEKAMFEKVKSDMEKEMTPTIDNIVKSALQEIESERLNEGVTIDLEPNAHIKISDDGTSLEIGGSSETSNAPIEDTSITTTEIEPEETMDTTNLDEEIFEVENTPAAPAAPAPAPVPSAEAPAPAAEPSLDGEMGDMEEPEGEDQDAGFEAEVTKKLDAIMAALGAEESTEGDGTANAEGNVEIIDDENPDQQAQTPQMDPNTQQPPMQEDEMMFELDEDLFSDEGLESEDTMYEFDDLDMDETFNVVDEDDTLDLSDDDFGDDLEETRGVSFAANKLAGQRAHFQDNNLHHSPVGHMNEGEVIKNIKAQYESKVDELVKENTSLNKMIREYSESFVTLRKQIDAMQVRNAKFSYANKLLVKGGWTKEEKAAISEQFELVETREDAKKLYNKMISESKSFKKSSIDPFEKLKHAQPDVFNREDTSSKTINESFTKTLHETDESLRWKELAGIIKIKARD